MRVLTLSNPGSAIVSIWYPYMKSGLATLCCGQTPLLGSGEGSFTIWAETRDILSNLTLCLKEFPSPNTDAIYNILSSILYMTLYFTP